MAEKKPAQINQMAITVALTPQATEYAKAKAVDGDVQKTLGSWASYWVDAQARGGIMVEPADIEYMAEMNEGRRFRSSREIVTAVEKGAGRKEAQHCFEITMDPTHFPVLQELSEQQGRTPEEILQDAVAQMCSMNWIYEFLPGRARNIPFSEEMLAEVIAATGNKVPDSEDIFALVKAGIAARRAEPVAA